MDKEKLAELLNEVFISGVAYGMTRQAKIDAQEYHIVDEKTNKILFSDFSFILAFEEDNIKNQLLDFADNIK